MIAVVDAAFKHSPRVLRQHDRLGRELLVTAASVRQSKCSAIVESEQRERLRAQILDIRPKNRIAHKHARFLSLVLKKERDRLLHTFRYRLKNLALGSR